MDTGLLDFVNYFFLNSPARLNFVQKMMKNYQSTREKPAEFRTLTSLTVEEFDRLLPSFEAEWNSYIRKKQLNGKMRLRKYAPRQKGVLSTVEEKLFFILVYMKTNAIQSMMALAFGLKRDMCNKWIHILSPLLANALNAYKASKQIETVELAEEATYLADATERPIERPKQEQKEYYSGKKKMHTVKNLLLCTLMGLVLYSSATVEGKRHDKKLADEELRFSKKVSLLLDLGFYGFCQENVQVILPNKKPKNGELTVEQKQENKEMSSSRVKVENAIGSIKILRIVKDKNRNKKEGYRDMVFDIAVALHNFKIKLKT